MMTSNVIPRSLTKFLAEKMLKGMFFFKELVGEDILTQLWVLLKNGNRCILTTCDQPFLLDHPLSGYREVSRTFNFSIDSGLFRVFNSKIPEWNSNVLYYNKAEFARRQYAADHQVCGSLALPISENNLIEGSCLAVLELVTIKEKSNFDSEMENICRALKVIDLRSTEPPQIHFQNLSENKRSGLAEITNVLHAVCRKHQLPLALTWVPCKKFETTEFYTKGSKLSQNDKVVLCIENTACYYLQHLQKFVHACLGHYLVDGQCIVGKALQADQLFFQPNMKEYHISEYPLVHHLRKFGLNAAVAMRLRSIYTGDDDYILEFFLPVDMEQRKDQEKLLSDISTTMGRTLRTVLVGELLRNMNSKVSEYELNTADVKVDGTCEERMVRSSKKRSATVKHVGLADLQKYFSGSLKDAAKSLGVCQTTLIRICRKNGISRWPSRKINKVNCSLNKLQSVLNSVEGVEGGLKFDPGGLVANCTTIKEFNDNKGFESANMNMEEDCLLNENQVTGLNAFHINSFSESADKSQMAASDIGPSVPHSLNTMPSPMCDVVSFLAKEGNSICELDFPRCSSSNVPKNGNEGLAKQSSDIGSKITAKAIYIEDMIRFKFSSSTRCCELYQEVAKRFKLQIDQFQINYLDDEEEWAVLVSDSDLNECLEKWKLQGTRIMKFLVCDLSSFTTSSSVILV